MKFTTVILTSILFLSCKKKNHENHVTIDIQPFADVSKEKVSYVYKELQKLYPFVQLKQAVSLPTSAFYPLRGRYRADSLINFLARRTPEGHITIGITSEDISTTKDSITDWGIMGLGFCPGKSCVASDFRLSVTPGERLIQLFKVSIHELGHTQGLSHCEVKSCFMRDAEGRNPTNEEVEFCKKCKAILVHKGWKFTK
ncbi:MAG: matrixin family metalloprotease [Flavisolibacter sp.]